MKRLIIGTILLLAATVAITVIYFKNINAPAAHSVQVMETIPNSASLIFEFSNDDGFYELFNGNTLFEKIVTKQKLDDLHQLQNRLLKNPHLKHFFDQQHMYISVHSGAGDSPEILATIAAHIGFKTSMLDDLAKASQGKVTISSATQNGKEVYTINAADLPRSFYLVDDGNHILSGTFSKTLAQQVADYKPQKDHQNFLPIPDQQSSNSLASLYVNYDRLTPLFDQLFETPNTGIFRSFRMLPALAALTMNYKNDALMFNGLTEVDNKQPATYLTLFKDQEPVNTQLKDIFPSSTAYSTSFAVSNIKQFTRDLSGFQKKSGLSNEKSTLFEKVRSETGLQLQSEFNSLLNNEFAVVITRYDERYGIVSIKNGSQLRPLMVNLSNMVTDDVGQFKYAKLPFFLLGDAFSLFNRPYFMILDNYLILANSSKELDSYKDSYLNHKLLSKVQVYNDFDGFLPERSNVAFFLQFRNIFPILKRDLKPDAVKHVDPEGNNWGKFYGLSYQLSASERNFYTNFYMRVNQADTTANNN